MLETTREGGINGHNSAARQARRRQRLRDDRFRAFKSIASEHNFPLDIPSVEIGIGLVTRMLLHPEFYSLIAEKTKKSLAASFSTNARRLPSSIR
jgi:hypothetical protein